MAVMWPRVLPPDVKGNTLRSTECEVFRRLEAVLDDFFFVFYSRPWLGLKPDGEEIDGECDFVVAHSRLGILTLEVKGGAVAYDPHYDRWTSRDRWNVTHNIKNPVQQARSAKHELLKRLHASPNWKTRRVPARHGVLLPHSSAPSSDLGPDMPMRIFCFAGTFEEEFRDWILARFGDEPSVERRTSELGRDGLRALEDILAKPFRLRTPLGKLLSHDDAAIETLTQQQFHILRAIAVVPRVAISGGAGTGKTVLAMEEAKRCAERGAQVLFLCYNRGLATEVRCRLSDRSPVVVMTFHELCDKLTTLAGLPYPDGLTETELFEEAWPELLLRALDCLPDARYDAIIVDEGQDFLPVWWTAVEAALCSNGRGMLRIFYDNNQRVYSSANLIPEEIDSVPIRLTQNLRNTQSIHAQVRRHYTGYEIEAIGPEGVAVRWIKVESPSRSGKSIGECIARLHSLERIPPDSIAVLVADETEIKRIAPDDRLGGFPAVRCDRQSRGQIVVDSVRRFKGLERPVVIIAAQTGTTLSDELLYVAFSRARTHLIVVGTNRVLKQMRNMGGASVIGVAVGSREEALPHKPR